MLKIFISSFKRKIITSDAIRLNVSLVLIRQSNGVHELRDLPTFKGIEDIEFAIRRFRFYFRLKITEQIRKIIINFLHERHSRRDLDFDCYAFVCDFSGVPKHDKYDISNFWKLKKIKFFPNIGDVIFLISEIDNKTEYFHHAAIYIGYGLYISVMGAGGDLEIMKLKDMKKDFRAKKVFIAVPRL